MKITPDFSEAVESTNGEIPPGTYKTRVTKVEQAVGKTSGTPYLKVQLKIFGAEGEAARYNNWVAYTNLMLKGKGAGRLKEFLKAANMSLGEFETEQLLGKEVIATMTQAKNSDGSTAKWPEVKSFKSI